MIGQVVSMTPDYKKAKQAADRVFHLIGNVPRIDSYSDAGARPVSILSSTKKYCTRCEIEIHFSIQTTKFLRKYNLLCLPNF